MKDISDRKKLEEELRKSVRFKLVEVNLTLCARIEVVLMGAYKNYNIQIKGNVQDIGFRILVENIARSLNLRGMVYNDVDGTVKIVCQGAVSSVKGLIEEIKSKSSNVGATVEEVSREEIQGTIFLPPLFFKAPTDELSDVSRKLDIGVHSLQSIEKNTETLIENTQSLQNIERGTQENTQSLQKLVGGQEGMVKLLERIAEK